MVELRQRLKAIIGGRKATLKAIADGSGVPLGTLRNYYYEYTTDMRHSTGRAVENYINREFGRRSSDRA